MAAPLIVAENTGVSPLAIALIRVNIKARERR
jgi:hypothetical protein